MQHPEDMFASALELERRRLERGVKDRVAMAVLVQNTAGLGSLIDAAIAMASQAGQLATQLSARRHGGLLLPPFSEFPPGSGDALAGVPARGAADHVRLADDITDMEA